MAAEAAAKCGLWVAGVDVMEKKSLGEVMSDNPEDYVILEVNKGPQFKGFMEATGIDVPRKIVRYLATLINEK